MFAKLREKSDRFLHISLIISSVTLVLSFIGFILFLFFYIIIFAVGHAGEANWTLYVAITSFIVFLFSYYYLLIVLKAKKEQAKEAI